VKAPAFVASLPHSALPRLQASSARPVQPRSGPRRRQPHPQGSFSLVRSDFSRLPGNLFEGLGLLPIFFRGWLARYLGAGKATPLPSAFPSVLSTWQFARARVALSSSTSAGSSRVIHIGRSSSSVDDEECLTPTPTDGRPREPQHHRGLHRSGRGSLPRGSYRVGEALRVLSRLRL
jgi:hypothetical protein